MATTIQDIDVRVGEDVRLPYTPASGVDVSDFSSWQLVTYIYKDGTKIATITESSGTDGVITRTGTGLFYTWLKNALSSTFTPRGKYFWQTRRVDAGYDYALHEGNIIVKPYSE